MPDDNSWNTVQPWMTYTGQAKRYYGNDGYIYDLQSGGRVRGDPPKEVAPPPPPEPISNGYTPPSAPPPAPEPEVEDIPEPTQPEKRAEITKPAAGLETTIIAPPAPTVSYLTGNTGEQTTSRFLKKKKDDKMSLFA